MSANDLNDEIPYAMIEHRSSGKTIRFQLHQQFMDWVRSTDEQFVMWDFVEGCFVYDLLGDTSLQQHVINWDMLIDE